MINVFRPGAAIATALTLMSLTSPIPAYADCIVEGVAHRAFGPRIGDPTGPTLYIKKQPSDDFYYFVRLRDGRFIHEVMEELGQVRVRIHGDALSCPTEGIVRDLGTAVGDPQVIELAAEVPSSDASTRN